MSNNCECQLLQLLKANTAFLLYIKQSIHKIYTHLEYI